MTHDTDLTHDHDPPGTSTLEVYDADILAAESGLIVCSLQYRVGAFGFFYQGNDDAPGNMGLYDQAMALQWIKDNIRSFHGDGDQITLFGESAGITWYHGHGQYPVLFRCWQCLHPPHLSSVKTHCQESSSSVRSYQRTLEQPEAGEEQTDQ